MARKKHVRQRTRERPSRPYITPTEEELQAIALRIKKGGLSQREFEGFVEKLGYDEGRLRKLIEEVNADRLKSALLSAFETKPQKPATIALSEDEKNKIAAEERERFSVQRRLIAENQAATLLTPYYHTIKALAQLDLQLQSIIPEYKTIDPGSNISPANRGLIEVLSSLHEACKQYELNKALLNPGDTAEYDRGLHELEKITQSIDELVMASDPAVGPIVSRGIVETLVKSVDPQKGRFILAVYKNAGDIFGKVQEILTDSTRRSAIPDYEQKRLVVLQKFRQITDDYRTAIDSAARHLAASQEKTEELKGYQ